MGRAARSKKANRSGPRVTGAPQIAFERALSIIASGNRPAAIIALRQHLLAQPDHELALFHLGVALRDQGELGEAADVLEKLVASRPTSVAAMVHLAEALRRAKRLMEAEKVCDRALGFSTKHVESLVLRGHVRLERGDASAAEEDARLAIASEPSHALAHKLLFRCMSTLGRGDGALQAYREALGSDIDHEMHRWAGDQFAAHGFTRDGIVAYQRAITSDPHVSAVYANLTALLCRAGLHALALTTADIGLRIDSRLKELHFNRATVLEQMKRPEEALLAFAEVLRCDPMYGEGLVALCRLRSMLCDWEGLEEAKRLSCTMTYRRGIATSPFGILPITGSRAELLEANKVWARTFAGAGAGYKGRPALGRVNEKAKRLRVGYLSADFHEHATAFLLIEVLELHDRSRFETFGYSIGMRSGGPMRQRIIAALETFRDVSNLSHEDAARAIQEDGLDILVDLKGYTYQSRPEILARRPAPIQVNYLGYPSTMGARFIDYIVGDAVVTPFDHAPHYVEKIVQLPNSYQPNDRRRRVAEKRPDRAACGLPAEGFVFCCFNASYKLTPAVFDVWMRLLAQLEGSVLWLYAADEAVRVNLAREASSRGIDAERLIFASPQANDEHLARIALGDLFLDTAPVGAHTTASDALWVGLPVLALLGETFAARVSASLLHAVGLPELVAPSLEVYEREALRLAREPAVLRALRDRLELNLNSAPLFDSQRYTRNLEAAFSEMAALRDAGREPSGFAVEEIAGSTLTAARSLRAADPS